MIQEMEGTWDGGTRINHQQSRTKIKFDYSKKSEIKNLKIYHYVNRGEEGQTGLITRYQHRLTKKGRGKYRKGLNGAKGEARRRRKQG